MADKVLSKFVDGTGDNYLFRDPTKEATANKVTAWSATTTDTNYPSEKLVKDSLDDKQDALTTQTAYLSKGTATKVPQITTNSLGQVTGITEVTISGVTPASHTHGNIQNGGTLQSSDVTIGSGDKLVITDYSDSNKVARASASFDGSTTTTALTPKGTFEAFQAPITYMTTAQESSLITELGDL